MVALMNIRTVFFGALFAVTGISSAVSITACNRKPAPVTPESQAANAANGLPAPVSASAARSVTGTPTDNGYMALPPVTRIPGAAVVPSSPGKTVVVQPLPTAPGDNSRVTQVGAGPVAAVIGADSQSEPTVEDAKRLIEDYYAAVNRGAYESAYRMWASNGQASGKSLRDFASGYSDTSNVSVSFGDPGTVGAGAGQRNVVIPVRVIARQRDQSTKEFSGTYTLGRTVVDGATTAQKNWSIRAADIDIASR